MHKASIIDKDEDIFVVAFHLIGFPGELFEILIVRAQFIEARPTLIDNLLIMVDTLAQLRYLPVIADILDKAILVDKDHLKNQCTRDVKHQRHTTQQGPYLHEFSHSFKRESFHKRTQSF